MLFYNNTGCSYHSRQEDEDAEGVCWIEMKNQTIRKQASYKQTATGYMSTNFPFEVNHGTKHHAYERRNYNACHVTG